MPSDPDSGPKVTELVTSQEHAQAWLKGKRLVWAAGWQQNFPATFDQEKDVPSEDVYSTLPLSCGDFHMDGTLRLPLERYVVLSTELAYYACCTLTQKERGRWYPVNFDREGEPRPQTPPFGPGPAIFSNGLAFVPIWRGFYAFCPERVAHIVGYLLLPTVTWDATSTDAETFASYFVRLVGQVGRQYLCINGYTRS